MHTYAWFIGATVTKNVDFMFFGGTEAAGGHRMSNLGYLFIVVFG